MPEIEWSKKFYSSKEIKSCSCLKLFEDLGVKEFVTVHKDISQTLSVRIPQSNALESVSSKASTLRAAILRQAS